MCKSIALKLIGTSVSLCFLVFGFVSCGEDEPAPEPQGPTIASFSPTVGQPGTVVTIFGANFDVTPAKNTVKFSNMSATVSEATATSLKVTVPPDAVTGKIEVTVNNKSVVSAAEFVIPPVITDFSPKVGIAGSTITIVGKGFSSTAANNIVRINDILATVLAASATSLQIEAPTYGYSGTMSVQIGGTTANTTEIFKYTPVITSFDPLRGPVKSNITITGSGFSKDPESNIVKIGDVVADVISGTANQLVVKIAEGTETGLISVSSGGSVATSATTFAIIVEAWSGGGDGFDAGYSIGVDGAGNSYVAGSFVGSATFGATVLTGENEEIFVAKYNPKGEPIWAVSAGGPGSERAMSIVVDNAGNSYIAGNLTDGAVFGSLPPRSALGYDAFVAKLNSAGEFQWVQSFGGIDTDQALDIALGDDGHVVAIGGYLLSVTVGTTTLNSPGGASIFVTKFNGSNGSPIWAKGFGGTYDDYGITVSVNSDGEIYVGGDFFGSVTLGANTFNASPNTLNSFILKLDDLGTILWAKHISGNDWNNVLDIATDAAGNCVITGYFTNLVSIGTSELAGVSNEEIFFAKLESADGDVIFAKKAGGTDYDNGKGIALDLAGNIYLAGHFAREATFNNTVVRSKNNSRDVFVAKYDSNGSFLWLQSAGGDDHDEGNDVCVAPDGTIYLTGSFRDFPATFGATVLENVGNDDVFVYRILP